MWARPPKSIFWLRSQHIPTYPNISQHIPTYPNISQHIPTYPIPICKMWDRQTLSCRPFRYRPVDARDPTFSSRQDPRNGHVCHFSTGYIVDSNGKRVRLKCVNWPYPWCAIRTLLKRTFHLMLHTFHTARSRLSFFLTCNWLITDHSVSFSTPRYGAHLEQMVANGLDRVSPGSTSLWVFFSQKDANNTTKRRFFEDSLRKRSLSMASIDWSSGLQKQWIERCQDLNCFHLSY